MANTLLTNDIILKTALMEFSNNLQFAKSVRRDYQEKFNSTTGGTIRIRKPTRYTARTGSNVSIQDINQQYTDISVSPMVGVDVEVTSTELALELDDFNRDVISPAMVTLGNKIDSLLYATTSEIYNFVGTAGTSPNSFATPNNAAAFLDSQGVPQGKNRFMMLKSFEAASLRNALYNTFNENFNKEIIMQGSMGNLAGFDCYSVQNIIRPANSSITTSLGTPLVNTASQLGATLITDGWTASITGILKAGATFTIAGVNSVNPDSRTDTGQLACFTVTADANSDVSGNSTLAISPAIVLTGPYQNVTALPANNAAITVNATHTINFAYHQEAFALVTIKLPEVANGNSAFQKNMMDKDSNINIRMTRQYQISNDKDIIRFDVLPAFKCFPEYAVRVMGS